MTHIINVTTSMATSSTNINDPYGMPLVDIPLLRTVIAYGCLGGRVPYDIAVLECLAQIAVGAKPTIAIRGQR